MSEAAPIQNLQRDLLGEIGTSKHLGGGLIKLLTNKPQLESSLIIMHLGPLVLM